MTVFQGSGPLKFYTKIWQEASFNKKFLFSEVPKWPVCYSQRLRDDRLWPVKQDIDSQGPGPIQYSTVPP